MPFRVQDHIDDLRDPAVFPGSGPGAEVEVVQTHCSVVCLVGERAYKFKKALRLPFLDFTDPEDRRRICHDEVRLNRRFAEDTYLGVYALVGAGAGYRCEPVDSESVDSEPDTGAVDHAVVMRRLPADRMLDVLLEKGQVDTAAIDDLSDRLVDFHRRVAEKADDEVRRAGAPQRLVKEILANFESLPGLHEPLVAELRAFEERGLERLEQRLDERLRAGRVVEGHGDLHTRNICLTRPPTVYDCLEFRFDLRCGDVASEVGFLAMDLAARGAHRLSVRFVERYVEVSGDRELLEVLPSFVRYRALVRAKVDAIGAGETEVDDATRAELRDSSARHLRLAAVRALAVRDPGLVLLASGLPASGKSTVFEQLRELSGWPRLSSDAIRRELFGRADDPYTPAASQRVYQELLDRAAASPDAPVLLDANFRSRAQRDAARARLAGRPVVTIRFDCSNDEVQARLAARAEQDRQEAFHSEADATVRAKLAEEYEPADRHEEAALVVDTGAGRSPGEVVDDLLTALLRRPS